jgi:hypothetical protein
VSNETVVSLLAADNSTFHRITWWSVLSLIESLPR